MRNLIPQRRPSPSMCVALLALFIALGGTATAAIVVRSSSQVKNGVLRGADLRNGTITAKDVKNESLTSEKIDNGTVKLDDLEAGARSAIQAAGTQALEGFRLDGPGGVPAGQSQRVGTLNNIPPGVYAIFGKTILTGEKLTNALLGQGQSISGHCTMDAGGDVDEARGLLGAPGANSPGTLNLQITRTFSETGAVTLTCDVQDAEWRATNTSIIAIRLGAASRSALVEGR